MDWVGVNPAKIMLYDPVAKRSFTFTRKPLEAMDALNFIVGSTRVDLAMVEALSQFVS